MKLFAIITAGLMAAGGGIYYFTNSPCSKSSCNSTAPIAKTGGCCSTGDAPTVCGPSEQPGCCSAQDEGSFLQKASCSIATGASTAPSAKAVESEGCCSACVTPTLNITIAAKSIATANK